MKETRIKKLPASAGFFTSMVCAKHERAETRLFDHIRKLNKCKLLLPTEKQIAIVPPIVSAQTDGDRNV